MTPQPIAEVVVDLEGPNVHVLGKDSGWYSQRKIFEEKASLLYPFIGSQGFTNFVDIGASVGLMSIFARRACPALRVIAIEADPRLVQLIHKNFQVHGLGDAIVVNAIAGDHEQPSTTFSLNPSSSLDNRVHIEKWEQIQVPMVRVDRILDHHAIPGKTFFKIDTQGFEFQVLKGIENWLATRADWAIKLEFAPAWLRSQGTDPAVLLAYLEEHYQFVEFPERIPFGTPGLDALFSNPVTAAQHASFLTHVVSLNKNQLGWVDLLIRPRP